jgi:hypothetical protein
MTLHVLSGGLAATTTVEALTPRLAIAHYAAREAAAAPSRPIADGYR